MIRAMHTASTGMSAQQLNIDTIAHNLANVNTTGFKRGRAEFADLAVKFFELELFLLTHEKNKNCNSNCITYVN